MMQMMRRFKVITSLASLFEILGFLFNQCSIEKLFQSWFMMVALNEKNPQW